ncbi:MAG: hypothetical protein PHR47_01190 [Candidatus Pacebacteria bacterium]|nr:hypothetical protein [Candidatus Paceibacterota bacterium]
MAEEIKEKKEEQMEEHKHTKRRKKLSKGFLVGFFIGIILASIGYVGYWYYLENKDISPEAIKTLTTDFINENLMGGGKIEGLTVGTKQKYYNLNIAISKDNSIETVVSADGTKFCVSNMDIVKKKDDTASSGIKKSDKPSVELFVMSHCPYGTQIEKGIIPVIETLGDNINFSLKFCDYSMHGEKELKEELNQYCIQKEQKDKLLSYLKCFLKAGNSEACLSSTGIDRTKLASCSANADKEYSVMSNFKNKVGYKGDYPGFAVFESDNTAYGVSGSPTLVINGTIDETAGRNSAGILKSICNAFNNAPESCNAKLSSDNPSAGFGEGTTSGNAANASCE